MSLLCACFVYVLFSIGVFFICLGLGLMVHFGLGVLSILDVFIILVGIWMLIDGIKNYLPVRKEQSALAK